MAERVLILGDPRDFHVGGHFRDAARELGHQVQVCDVRLSVGNRLAQRISWHLFDRSYANQRRYERVVESAIREFGPTVVLATGYCPVGAQSIGKLRKDKIRFINFLTDDPWNPRLRSKWFFASLREYDAIFSPRRSNLRDLTTLGCRHVEYLPFAYNPHQHYPVDCQQADPRAADVLFVGGADNDRVPFVHALVDSGLKVMVFGGYWHRYSRPGLLVAGLGSNAELRHATAAAKVTLLLVRRANRDGHVMRTFEAAAQKACLLVEDSAEHRDIYGGDNECVKLFANASSMIQGARALTHAAEQRRRLRENVHQRIVVDGKHTYRDRLASILDTSLRQLS